MGDRALVIIKDKKNQEISPTVYLHWSGESVPKLIEQLKETMQGRLGDVPYTTARFIGICHEHVPGNLSLGVWQTPDEIIDAVKENDAGKLADYSHGDGGVVVVDCSDCSWQAFGGYLEEKQRD